AAVERLGARVHLEGASVEDALELAAACAHRSGRAFVHPFDDLDVIAGQGTVGLELLEDVPDLARVIVPVGGGGLASGIGVALAMVFLAENAKLVSEGAGAVAVAAVMSGSLPPAGGTTVSIVSGGNVDGGLLAGLLRRRETEEGRRVRIFTRVADRPGGLAE